MKLKRRLTKFAAMAAITYFLDPKLGPQRRRELKRQLERLQASFAEQRTKWSAGRGRTGPTADDAPVDAIALPERTARVEPPAELVADLTVPRAV